MPCERELSSQPIIPAITLRNGPPDHLTMACPVRGTFDCVCGRSLATMGASGVFLPNKVVIGRLQQRARFVDKGVAHKGAVPHISTTRTQTRALDVPCKLRRPSSSWAPHRHRQGSNVDLQTVGGKGTSPAARISLDRV